MDYQKLLLEHLDLVDRIVGYTARRHRLSGADAEEFASTVRYKLLDRDFAVLRKFQGRSNLSTYLTTVIGRIYLDFCIARWGKWRPSAAARRLGPGAVLLEQLIGRDGLTFDEAVETLHTNHHITATPEELHTIARQLPLRIARRFASEEELAMATARVGHVDRALDSVDDTQVAARVGPALTQAVAALPARDQLILKLRFQEDFSMPDIGRLMHTPAKPLYRHLRNIVAQLRERLSEQGIDQNDIERIVGNPAITLGRVFDAAEPGDSDDESV